MSLDGLTVGAALCSPSYLVDGRKQPGLHFVGAKQGKSREVVDVYAAQRGL